MKKILNDPETYVDEMLAGMCRAHPEYYRQLGPQGRVIARPDAPVFSKVGIVSGGGSLNEQSVSIERSIPGRAS